MLDIQIIPSGPLQTNTILIVCLETNKAAVIDPSLGSTSLIMQKAKEMEAVIEKILLTHSHWDHFADAYQLKKELHVSLFVHPLDAQNLLTPGFDGISLRIPMHAVEYDGFLEDGQWISIGNHAFQVIHTPGHSPGGVCFYCAKENLLISGDTLFQGCMGTLALPTAEAEKMWHSLKKLATLPPSTRVIPGHGKETTIGKEKWMNRAEEFFA